MVLAFSEVRRVVERVCARQDVPDACARRDLGFVIAVLNENRVTQEQISSLTGLHQNRLSNYKTGKHAPKEYSVFASFAGGLGLPPAARQALGLDGSSPTAAGIVVPQPRPAPPAAGYAASYISFGDSFRCGHSGTASPSCRTGEKPARSTPG